MSSQIIPVECFDYIVFGGNGDLAERKLLPALYHRDLDGQIPPGARIIGASRTPFTDEEYRAFGREALNSFVGEAHRTEEAVERFLSRLYYRQVDARSETGWAELKSLLDEAGQDRIRAFYLAVSPSLFGDLASSVKRHGLAHEKTRIVVEKPVGRDLASAKALNALIGEHFDESQVFCTVSLPR